MDAPSGIEQLESQQPALLPVFLKLAGRDVLVVGAGGVAAAKLPALLDAKARVRVVAPEVRPEILRLPVLVRQRGFVPADLDGAWYVVAAATREVNARVSAAADERRILANVVDEPRLASAYCGGVVRRGGVLIALSTEGRAPALTRLLREALDEVIPRDVERWLRQAVRQRRRWRRRAVPTAARGPLLLQALTQLYRGRGAMDVDRGWRP